MRIERFIELIEDFGLIKFGIGKGYIKLNEHQWAYLKERALLKPKEAKG